MGGIDAAVATPAEPARGRRVGGRATRRRRDGALGERRGRLGYPLQPSLLRCQVGGGSQKGLGARQRVAARRQIGEGRLHTLSCREALPRTAGYALQVGWHPHARGTRVDLALHVALEEVLECGTPVEVLAAGGLHLRLLAGPAPVLEGFGDIRRRLALDEARQHSLARAGRSVGDDELIVARVEHAGLKAAAVARERCAKVTEVVPCAAALAFID